MEFVLLFLTVLGYFVHYDFVHLLLLLAHYIVAGWIGIRLLDRQPLSAAFIAVYALMFFTNPTGITLGLVELENSSSQEIFYKSNAIMMAGLNLFIIGAVRFRGSRPIFKQQPRLHIRNGPVEVTVWVGTIASFLALILVILVGRAQGIDVFIVHKTYRTTGNQDMTYLIATYVTSIIPLIFFCVAQRKFGTQLVYFAALLSLIIIYFMIFRNRTLPIACMIGYIVGLVARFRFLSIGYKPVLGRLPSTVVMIVIISGPVLLTAGLGLRYVRGAYQLQDFSFTTEHVQREIDHALTGGELGYAYMTREAIRLFPSQHPYLYGQTYYRLLFTPIPRQVWPTKPLNTNRLFANIRDRELGRKGVTQSAGVVGTMYINFGVFGVFGMFFAGLLFSFEKYVRLYHLLILAASGLWMVAIVRGSITAPIMTFLFVYVLARMFEYFARPSYALPPDYYRG